MLVKCLICLTAIVSLSACGTTPKNINMPTPIGCPELQVADSGSMPVMPIESIDSSTPLDVAARLWKASLLELLGYTKKVEIEKTAYKKAYGVCSNLKNELTPVSLEPQDP